MFTIHFQEVTLPSRANTVTNKTAWKNFIFQLHSCFLQINVLYHSQDIHRRDISSPVTYENWFCLSFHIYLKVSQNLDSQVQALLKQVHCRTCINPMNSLQVCIHQVGISSKLLIHFQHFQAITQQSEDRVLLPFNTTNLNFKIVLHHYK